MDEAAFADLVRPHRAALEAHCYRMLGSVHDAEDVAQESLLRAWKGIDAYDPTRPVRPWLYAIATNRCLTLLGGGRARREFPDPYPDARWEGSAEDAALVRESVELAFVTALQELPPKPRAALLLCEVLSFPAREAAGILDTTTASVTSALQRARRTLGTRPGRAPADEHRGVAARYAAAWEAGDVDAIVGMLAADARYAMPPLPERYAGRAAIRGWLLSGPLDSRWRFRPARANGQPAFRTYRFVDGGWVPSGLDVLTLRDGAVAEVVSFLDADFSMFGLPMRLPAGGGT